MSTIKSSSEHLTLNADGASKDIKFQANGVEKASISSAGAFTSTTIDATKLTGALPAISGASLTNLPASGLPSGTKVAFFQASAPTGWTQDTGNNDKVLRVVSGTGGGTGGSWDLSSGDTSSSTGAHTHTGPSHTHSTPSHSHSHSLSAGSHTLSTSQMPSHNHSTHKYDGDGQYGHGDTHPGMDGTPNYNTSTGSTSSTGGSSSHSHSLSGSISSGGSGTSGSGGTGNTSSNGSHTHTISAPKYIDVIVCSKD